MPDPQQTRNSLLAEALQSYRDEYKELSDTWRHIEGKAQGTVGIAGIFLAAVFAFARGLAGADPPLLFRVTLIAALVLLATCIVLAVLTLLVTEVPAPPLGETMDEMVGELSGVTDDAELAQRMPRFVSDQAELWQDTNESTDGENKKKAERLKWAQGLLVAAILLVAGLTIATIGGV